MYKYSPLEVWYLKEYGSAEQLDEYLSNVSPMRPYGYKSSGPKKPSKCHLSKEKKEALEAALAKIERDFGRRGKK